MKKADATGARYALIIGDDEAAAGTAQREAAARRRAVRRAGRRAGGAARRPDRRTNLNPRAPDIGAPHIDQGKHMAVYDLEEQEQLEDLKAWWRQWGNYVSTAVHRRLRRHRRRAGLALVAAQPGRAGVGALRRGQRGGARERRRQGEGRDGAARRQVRAAPATRRAAALLAAKLLFDNGDKAGAKAQLQWVIDKATRTS